MRTPGHTPQRGRSRLQAGLDWPKYGVTASMAIPSSQVPPRDLRAQLTEGESLRWWGRPHPSGVLSCNSVVLFALGIFVCGLGMWRLVSFILVATYMHSSIIAAGSLVIGSEAIVALGLGGVFFWGIFATSGYEQRTSYAITSVRVIKVVAAKRAGSPPKVSFAPLVSMSQCTPLKGPSGRTTIQLRFVPNNDMQLQADRTLTSGGPNPTLVPGLGLSNRTQSIAAAGVSFGTGQAPAASQLALITFSELDDAHVAMTLLEGYQHGTQMVP